MKKLFMAFAAAAMIFAGGCSDTEQEPVPQPKPEEDGAISFTLDFPQGSGNGTSSSPVVVKKGETLNLTISQKSSYTDPDGTVFTCEPEAVIKLFAKQDTIVARDLKELTEVKGGADVKTHKTGTSPVLNQTVQTFDVGGQNIVFDLSHEIYSYVTSTKDRIEMPYVKLNQARLGSTGATEETPQGRSVAVVAGVTVRPLTTTRGPVLRDSTMYDVNVRFSLDLESVHAKRDTRQTLEFSVNYVGIVETVTELPDPVAEVSYTWDVKSGTTGTASPFVKTKGKTPMEIWMAQSCSYTDEYGNKITGAPKAKIKLSVAQDTVWTKKLDDLKKFAVKEGGTSSEQAATQKFGSDLQNVDVEWSYEVSEGVLADKTVSMPFYALTGVSLKDVSVKEAPDKGTLAGRSVDVYEVTATFSQKAAAKNVTTATPDVEVEYVVSYIGVVGETVGEPAAALSYAWEVKSGTESKASPFVKTKGRTPMEIWMAQSSTYTDGRGGQATGEPKAKIKLSVAQDTVWTKTLDELKTFAAKEGEKPSGQAATQKFGSDLQEVAVEWSYETGEAVIGETSVPLPFYALEPATLKGVSVKEVSDGEEIGGKMASLYEVTATFCQKAVAKQVENVSAETPAVEIEYVVSYIGAVELTLKDVEYIPGGEWREPHHNMSLAYYAKVERYRTYSNGKRVGPDVFYDYGHSVEVHAGRDYDPKKKDHGNGIWLIAHPYTLIGNIGDTIFYQTQSTQLSNMGKIQTEKLEECITSEVAFKDWDNYRFSAPEDESRSVAKDFDNKKYPADHRPSGWYYSIFYHTREDMEWWTVAEDEFILGPLMVCLIFYDQFLVIDGRRIDFSELHNFKADYTLNESDFSEAHKEGKILKLEGKYHYLGRNFYGANIDTLYVAK